MKLLNRFLVLFLMVSVMVACNNAPQGDDANEGDQVDPAQASTEAVTYNVNTSSSVVNWLGTKPTGQHAGTLSLKEGSLSVKDGNIEAGKFVIDMATMKCTDEGMDEESKQGLVGHLSNEDFFEVEKYPTASFEIAAVSAVEGEEGMTHLIKGNLMMKDTTHSIEFKANVSIAENGVTAETADFNINRTLWGVNYGSKSLFPDLKDKFINDEMGIKIKLVAEK